MPNSLEKKITNFILHYSVYESVYFLHLNRFHLFKKYIYQLLMIQPVIPTVGRKVGRRLWADDKLTDFFNI